MRIWEKIEPVTKFLKNFSEDVTKTITETSKEYNKAVLNSHYKLLEIMNNRGILSSHLLSFYLKSLLLNILANIT